MNLKQLRTFLAWCSIINFGLLLFSGLIFLFANDLIFDIEQTFMSLPKETFDAIWFTVLAIYKILIIIFFIVPYFVVRKMDNSPTH